MYLKIKHLQNIITWSLQKCTIFCILKEN